MIYDNLKRVTLLVTVFLFLIGCDQSDQSSVPQDMTFIKKEDKPKEKSLWPFLTDEERDNLSENMLASNIYVVFDGSGSMGGSACSGRDSKIISAKNALQSFIENVPDDANLGLSVFDRTGTSERAALAVNNRDHFRSEISNINIGGETPLSKAINGAYEKLTKQARQQLGYGEYHLVVITDGEASAGYAPDKIIEKLINQSPVVLHTIGFCINENHSLNQPGRTIYKTATDYDSLKKGLQSVLAESPEFSVAGFN